MSLSDLWETGFPRTVRRRQLAELLAERYSDYSFERIQLLHYGRFAQQKQLERIVASLFPVPLPSSSISIPSCCSMNSYLTQQGRGDKGEREAGGRNTESSHREIFGIGCVPSCAETCVRISGK